jgi:hypothetical protein
MRLPLPQLALVQVTWSSSVFWRHLQQQSTGRNRTAADASAVEFTHCRLHDRMCSNMVKSAVTRAS